MTASRAAYVVAASLALFACEAPPVAVAPPPPPRPETPPEPETPAPRRTAESLDLEVYYARLEDALLVRGLLRDDGGGPDTPWDAATLERAFLATAFRQEYTEIDGRLVLDESEVRLRRWERPVRVELRTGPFVAPATRAEFAAELAAYAARLARASGADIAVVDRGGNFRVFLLHDAERRRIGPELRRAIPGIGPAPIEAVETLSRATYCPLIVSDRGDDGRITEAVTVIRAELPKRLRIACLHEELAQGLGLANDSDEARPSIFADDDEFGRLTSLDEALITMLYDARLRPGMTADEAAPLLPVIAAEIAPEPAS